MMDIKRIIEIASELDTLETGMADTYGLKVCEPLRRAVSKKKLNFVEYLLTCEPEERRPLFSAYQAALVDSNAVVDGILKEGYEKAYKVYEMMCEEQGMKSVCDKLKLKNKQV